MIVNFYITKNRNEMNSFNGNWVNFPQELDDDQTPEYKHSTSNGNLGIVYNRDKMDEHFTADLPNENFEIKPHFIDKINNTINRILNGEKRNIEKINIIVHWGGLDINSTSKDATKKLEEEVKKYCNDNGCDYIYKFYHFSKVIDKHYKLNIVMNFENNWQNILKKFDPRGNPELEAKLNLLHQCLNPNGIPESLDPLLANKNGYETAFATFKNGKNGSSTFDDDYITTLSNFRDELLKDEKLV